MPYSQQTAKEKVFEIILFEWKCCHFDSNIFQPLDIFHFSLFFFFFVPTEVFIFSQSLCYCLETYSDV